MKLKIPFTDYFISKHSGNPAQPFTQLTGPGTFFPLGYISFGANLGNLDTRTIQGQRNAYVFCPPVTAVINAKASYFVNGRFHFTNSKGEEVASQWQKLINKPNPKVKSWKQFSQYAYTLAQIFGVCYIYKRTFAGMTAPERKYELWIMPNWEVTVNKSASISVFSNNIYSYTWQHDGQTIVIQPEDVFTINDTGFDLLNTNAMYETGASRLVSLREPVKNVVAAYMARGKILRHGGPPMIIGSAKDNTGQSMMIPKDQKKLEDEYENDYGFGDGQRTIKIVATPITATKLGINPNDLAAFEEVREDIKQICNNYTFAHEIFGIEGTTFANKGEAKKWTYQNATIPEAATFNETLTSEVGMTENLTADFSHVEELQESESSKFEAMGKLTAALKPMIDAKVYTPGQVAEILYNNTNIDLPEYIEQPEAEVINEPKPQANV